MLEDSRGWITSRRTGCHTSPLHGKKEVAPETAVALGAAFDTGAEYWVNLESQYRLWLVGDPDPAIAKRAAQVSRRRSVADRAAQKGIANVLDKPR